MTKTDKLQKIADRIAELDRLEALRAKHAPTYWGTLDAQRADERKSLLLQAAELTCSQYQPITGR